MKKEILFLGMASLSFLAGCNKTQSTLGGAALGTGAGAAVGYAIDGGAGGAILGGVLGPVLSWL